MSDRVFIRPVQGVLLRNPFTGELVPEAGIDIQLNSFWRRRLQEGCIVIAEPTKTTKTKQGKGDNS